MIMLRTCGRRSSCMNMCSVRQRPMPSAPNSRARRASSGVSALVRTPRRRTESAQVRILLRFSLTAGRRQLHLAQHHLAGGAVHGDPVALFDHGVTHVELAGLHVDLQIVRSAGDAGSTHAPRHHGRVRRHASVAGDDTLGLDESVDVVRVGLPTHEDDLLAPGATLFRVVGGEDHLAHGRPRRGVQTGGQQRVGGLGVQRGVQTAGPERRDRCGRWPLPW